LQVFGLQSRAGCVFPRIADRPGPIVGGAMNDNTGPNEPTVGTVTHVPGAGEGAAPAGALAAGARFAGYEILGELGRGGMGVVYKARQLGADRLVALKVIRTDRLELLPEGERRQWVGRFHREAQLVAALDRPAHIVTLHEVGEHQGQPYFTMRLVEGGNLAQRQREIEAAGPGPASARRVREQRASAALLAQVAQAIDYAHRRGILHRDLKPANILLDGDGQPLVTDFGLARRLDETGSLVAAGFEGTASYAAPEQARAAPGAATTAADVYGLGAILYELLTGRPPFRGPNDVETLLLVLTSEPEPPRRIEPRLSRDLETICLKCLEKEPARRYRSAAALADDLENWLAGRPIAARPAGKLERAWRACRRNPVLTAAAAAVVVTAAAAFGLITASRDRALDARAAAERLAEEKDDLARRNAGIAAEKTELALTNARLAERERELRSQVQREFANSSVKQGQHFLERGDVRQGALYLAQGVNLAHQARAADLEQAGRTQLALWRPRFRPMQTLLPHPDEVLAVAFSPDGTKLVTGGADKAARLWDTLTGRALGEPHRPQGRDEAELPGWPFGGPFNPTFPTGADGRPRHGGEIVAVAFSPDGRALAAGAGDPFYRGRSQLVQAGDRMRLLRGADLGQRLPGVGPGAFDRGGPTFPGRLRSAPPPLWEADTGKPLVPSSSGQPVWAVAFSPDGKKLVTGGGRFEKVSLTGRLGPGLGRTGLGGYDPFDLLGRRRADDAGQAQLWDVANGTLLRSMPHGNAVLAVAFSPDGRFILTGSADQTARFWDEATGRQLGKPLLHDGLVVAVAFSPDGRTALTCSQTSPTQGAVQLWVVSTGEKLGQPLVHSSPVLAAAFSPDGRTALTGSGDSSGGVGEAQLWDVATGRRLGEPLPHPGAVHSVAWSPDGLWIATGCADKVARVWGAVPAPAVVQRGHHENALAYSPDGARVLLGSVQGSPARCSRVSLAETSTGRALSHLAEQGEATGRAVFSPDGRRALVEWNAGDNKGSVLHLLDAASGRQVGKPIQVNDPVEAVAFAPGGRTVAVGTSAPYQKKGEAILWDADTGELLHTFAFAAPVLSVAFSPDGGTVAAGAGMPSTKEGEVRLWDVGTGRLIRSLPQQGPVRVVLFSPDGRTVAAAGDDHAARLWGVADGRPRGAALAHNAPVRALAFSADGGRLLTGSDDRTAQLWDVAAGKRVGAPLTHRGPVRAVAVSRDGTLLLTGSDDQTAQLWEAATGRPLEEPLAHQGPVVDVAFGGDGRTALTRSTRTSTVVRRRVGDAWETTVGVNWGSTGRAWSLPAPLQEGPGVVLLGTQVLTGLELDAEGQVRPLDAPAWQERRQRLGARGEAAPAPEVVREWHRREARAAEEAGQWFAARWHLERLGEDEPAAEKLPLRLGRACLFSDRPQRAVAELTRALDTGEPGAAPWYFRGRAHAALGLDDRALADFSEAIRRAPASLPKGELWVLMLHRGQCYYRLGQMDKAVADLSQVLAEKQDHGPAWHTRGMAYAELGQLDRAAADFTAALRRPGAPARAWCDLAQARLQRGDAPGYRESCAAALQQLRPADDPDLAARLAWVLSLGPGGAPDPEQVVRLAWPGPRQDATNFVFARSTGAALYRAGKHKEAVERLTCALKLRQQPSPSVWLFLAMAHQRLEQPEPARQWLNKARAWIEEARNRKPDDKDGLAWRNLPWTERGALELLQAEAEKLIEGEAKP
jgi:WD40 repeat protein/tetratricopeptide (TPR) repeat protein